MSKFNYLFLLNRYETMFPLSNSKVKFQDQQLDDYVLENSVLKSKLQSKIDALCIISHELDKCSMERDRYKVLVEQLKCKNKSQYQSDNLTNNLGRFIPTNTITNSDLLTKTRDHNSLLKLEVETLRSKLEEATGDIVVLRKQLQNKQNISEGSNDKQKKALLSYTNQDYENLVQQLENLHKMHQQIQMDYRATLDEKEELINDRDYYKNKVQRLNHQVSCILTNMVNNKSPSDQFEPAQPIIDIDVLVTENKYLHERITQLQVEKEIIKRTLTKYKTLLENRKNDSLNLSKKGFADVMTQKQVRELLNSNGDMGLQRASAMELKSLCLGLFEALNDKSIALQHQRKTNQILANRITELEKTLESWCNGQKCVPIFPTQMLIDELLPEWAKFNESHDKTSNAQDDDKKKSVGSDDDLSKEISDDILKELKQSYENKIQYREGILTSKTVLPFELEELVKEALAEIRPSK